MPTQLFFTAFLNQHFGAFTVQFLHALHVQPAYPEAPITNAFAMQLLVAIVLVLFFAIVRASLSVESPGSVQHLAELTHEFIADQSESIIGHGYERFLPYLVTLFLFLLLCNLLGLVPGFEAPTANPVVPLGLALVTFLYYHYHGIRVNKAGYVKQFLGPVWWISPLMLIVEIVSHFARILSLTVRLYANMYAGELLTLVFFSLIPIGLPLVFMGLHFGVAIIQAYVFMLLAIIYLSLATATEH